MFSITQIINWNFNFPMQKILCYLAIIKMFKSFVYFDFFDVYKFRMNLTDAFRRCFISLKIHNNKIFLWNTNNFNYPEYLPDWMKIFQLFQLSQRRFLAVHWRKFKFKIDLFHNWCIRTRKLFGQQICEFLICETSLEFGYNYSCSDVQLKTVLFMSFKW